MGVDELKDDVFKLTETPAHLERCIVCQRRQLGDKSPYTIVHPMALIACQVACHELTGNFFDSLLNGIATFSDHLGVF